MRTVAFYARTSTVGRQHMQSPETQLIALREYSKRTDIKVFSEYVDVGISGSRERRPALDRLMRDAHEHKFDMVIVTRFDRFARSVSHLLGAMKAFQDLGIDFVSLAEALDTSTPIGRMVFTVIASIAELERELIRERVFAGLHRARLRGKQLGRPSTCVIDESRLQYLLAEEYPTAFIAKQLGVPRSTLRGILARRCK